MQVTPMAAQRNARVLVKIEPGQAKEA